MRKQQLIAYINDHTQLVPSDIEMDGIVIDLNDFFIALRGTPEREKLLKLVNANSQYERKSSASAKDKPTIETFNPFGGGQFTHVELDRWLGGLHTAWRDGLKAHERRKQEAHVLSPDEVKELSLRFMAVASALKLTKLVGPQTLITEGMEAKLQRDLQQMELRRKSLPAETATDPQGLRERFAKDEEELAKRPDEIRRQHRSYLQRGFYAITTDRLQLSEILISSRKLGTEQTETAGAKPSPI